MKTPQAASITTAVCETCDHLTTENERLRNDEHWRSSLMYLAQRQADWSQNTFGHDSVRGPIGAIKHLRDECVEMLAAPYDITEYADALLLILDASRRAGFTVPLLLSAAHTKQTVNEGRKWPTPVNDEPVQHERNSPRANQNPEVQPSPSAENLPPAVPGETWHLVPLEDDPDFCGGKSFNHPNGLGWRWSLHMLDRPQGDVRLLDAHWVAVRCPS